MDATTIYRSLFSAYADALLLVDTAGRIVLANPAATTLLGYSPEEFAGLSVDALVPDAIRPRHAAYREGYARAPRPRPMGTQMDLVARRKDGSEVLVEIALSPLQDEGLPYVVAAIRDIGGYPRVKQALKRARYAEHLARVGGMAVDTRDPQQLLQRVPQVAVEALQAGASVVLLLEPDRQTLRVAGRAGDAADGDDPAGTLAVPLTDRGQTVGTLTASPRAGERFGEDEERFLQSLAHLLAASLQRAQTEEQLNHAQRLESVGQLTGGIAHDFNLSLIHI